MRLQTIIVLAVSCSTGFAQPTTVDGIPFEKFVDIQRPVGLAFDARDNLYVGNGSSGTGSDPIRFIPADGSAVIRLGPPIVDPDFLVVDVDGHFTEPGNVLVAGSPLVALNPSTGDTTTVLNRPPIQNVSELFLDDGGSLFVGQKVAGKTTAEVLRISKDGTIQNLITVEGGGVPQDQ